MYPYWLACGNVSYSPEHLYRRMRYRRQPLANKGHYGSKASLIARFMRPTWGPSGTDRTQVGLMLAPWTCWCDVLKFSQDYLQQRQSLIFLLRNVVNNCSKTAMMKKTSERGRYSKWVTLTKESLAKFLISWYNISVVCSWNVSLIPHESFNFNCLKHHRKLKLNGIRRWEMIYEFQFLM